MSAIASNDEEWYFVPSQICFSEYALHAGQKQIQQKVLARSRQHFQTASVELTSFHLDCFGINGTCAFENAGPDSTFVFSVSFDIPPPQGLLLQGEFRSNFQDQVHIRHSGSGSIMATLIVKAIWDLTPDHVAVFYPSVLSSSVAPSCLPRCDETALLQQQATADHLTRQSVTTDHADSSTRPKYDEAEDSFYRSLLAGKAAHVPGDTSLSKSISAPKDTRIKLTADDAAFYSTVIAGVNAAPAFGEIKKPKPTKAVVNFEGDDFIIIDGVKYDTWGNVISDITDSKPQVVPNALENPPACDLLDAKKKLPQLGPTVVRGSNVLAMSAPQAMSASQACRGGEHDGNRYLEILNGNLVPETRDTGEARESTSKRPVKKTGGTGCQGSSLLGQSAAAGTKSAVSASISSHHQKLQASSVLKSQAKTSAPKSAVFSPLKSEDEFNDAWDAL
jgi:hypothetical protein